MKKSILLLSLLVSPSVFSQNVSPEKKTYDKLFEKVSNKGKWGNKDKKGTVNYIDNNKILNALKLPEKGISVSLSFNITQDSSQINHSDFDEFTKYNHQASSVEFKGYDWATDNYSISYHGFTVSHMDGLAHLGQGGKLYNGYDASNITSQGFEELGIEAFSGGIMSKGVLIDIPLLYGKEYLDAGTKITINDILKFEEKYNVKIEKGDIVLIRTGRWSEKSIKGDSDYSKVSAGVDYKITSLLYERQVSVLGSDGTNDAQPSGIPEEGSPVHKLTLVSMGMPLLDNLNLEQISKEAKKQNKWEFFISVQPLRFKGGTGSPVNAIALF
ncbi:cyclase family protein [Flavobacteriaceae bacterium]|nr:cyclase family protein [Flavobacteriaceae bacterium]